MRCPLTLVQLFLFALFAPDWLRHETTVNVERRAGERTWYGEYIKHVIDGKNGTYCLEITNRSTWLTN
jgi:hypothetical protein